MNKYDLLEAMSGIREEYIADAAAFPGQEAVPGAAAGDPAGAVHGTDTVLPGPNQEAAATKQTAAEHATAGDPPAAEKTAALRKKKKTAVLHMQRWAAVAAALLCVAILLPVLLPGQGSALRGIPLIGGWFDRGALSTQEMESAGTVQEETETAGEAANKAADQADNRDGAAGDGIEAESDAQAAAAGEEQEPSAEADRACADPGGLCAQAYGADDGGAQAVDGLTSGAEAAVEGTPAAFAAAAVRTSAAGAQAPEEVITRAAVDISRYESGVAEETGFESLRFTHHIITDAGSWFCMKVEACTTPAEGFEETVHFNYNAETGRFTGLRDLFPEGTDYITPISEEIRAQMRSRMEEDPDLEYWLDTAPETGQVFETISPRQDFYIDEDGILVICFDEMEAAPMYMGRLEFRIPEEVTQAAGMKIGK